jgi:superfamily II DNA or RNA helicase
MYGDFGDYSEHDNGFNVEELCHRIYSGKEKHNVEKRIIITTWQSIHKMPIEWYKNFGMVIGDEAHSFKAKSLTSTVEKCINASYRLGTTGTLDGTQTNQLVLEGLFGKVFKVTSTKELINNNSLADLKIKMLIIKYEDEICKALKGATYQEEVDFIVRNEKRNQFISNLALDQSGNSLILFQFVEKHGKVLYEMIKSKSKDPSKIHYVSGETDVDTREEIRKITELSDGAIIVASLGTFSTGINIKKLNNIIFASPSKSQVKVLQSIGRGLRKSPDGKGTKLFDFADDLHWKSKKNYTLNHAAERLKIYSKEEFDYKIYEIKL